MPDVIRSSLLAEAGIPHAFTTRRGGCSPPPFDSLNLGNPGALPPGIEPDRRENIDANVGVALRGAGCEGREVLRARQVHAGRVLVVRATDPTPAPTDADAIVTDDLRRCAWVSVADCAPVLLASGDGRIVAAIHAGWRGIAARVIPAAVDAARTLGARGLIAAVGPCIGPDAFEVGPEVHDAFASALGTGEWCRESSVKSGKYFADLSAAAAAQLRSAGVGRIDEVRRCTFSERAVFFSHRRDAGVTGRMAGIIGGRREPA